MEKNEQSKIAGMLRGLFAWLRSHPAWIAIFLVFALYFATRVIYLKGAWIFSDESHYVRWAQMAQAGNPWYSLIYDGKPPLHAWSIVPFLYLFKDPLIAGRISSVFFGALTMVGLIMLGREFEDLGLGALAAFLYVICPYTLIYNRVVEAEGMLLALFVFASFFAVKAARSGRLLYLLGTGVATGLALLTKGTALLLYPIVPFAYLVREPGRKDAGKNRPLVRWLVGVALSLVMGYGILNLQRLSSAYQRRSHVITGRTKSFGEAFKTLGDVPKFLHSIFGSLFRFLTPAVFVICFAGLVLGLVLRWRPAYFLWVWFIIGTAVISLISKNYWPRFYLVLLPPMLFGGAYAVHRFAQNLVGNWKDRRSGWKGRATVMMLIAVVVIPLVAIPVGIKTEQIMGFEFVPGGNYIAAGIDEVVSYLKDNSRDGKITVFTVSRDYGFLSRCLEMYLPDNANIDIEDLPHPVAPGPIPLPRSAGLSEVLARNRAPIEKALKSGLIYILVDSARFDGDAGDWQIEVVEKYGYPKVKELDVVTVNPQPAERDSLFLIRVDSNGKPP